jgi:hypothetical protein
MTPEDLRWRFERWTHATFSALAPLEVNMVAAGRDLAQFDIDLITIDVEVAGPDPAAGLMRAFEQNPRRFGLSRLWVLGAYELVRTIEQMLRRSNAPSSRLHTTAKDLKWRFERLRMPLAKFETARRFPGDWPIAYPSLHEQTGAVGWHVAPNEFIERRMLADRLLEFLEQLAASHRPPATP